MVALARTPRVKSESGIYHAMIRGVNKQTIFQDDEDRHRFISTMKRYKDMDVYKIYAYCLMDNHVHILLKEDEHDISSAMKRISASYVIWYNKKYERCGHLFQGRFKSEPVNSDAYFLTVLRYIHRNPIKAGIITNLEDYKWSSYYDFIYENHIVDRDFVFGIFSNNVEKAVDNFKKYHKEVNDDECLDINDNKILSDKEFKNIINKLNVDLNQIDLLDKGNRDEVLRKLKNIDGSSIRQISRITGISKSVIGRA